MKYCLETDKIYNKIKILQDKLNNLVSNNKTPTHKPIMNSENKYSFFFQLISSWPAIFIATNHFTPTYKSRTVFSITKTMIKVENIRSTLIWLFFMLI